MVEGCTACPRVLDPGSEFSNSNVKKVTLELVEFYSLIPVGRLGSFFGAIYTNQIQLIPT